VCACVLRFHPIPALAPPPLPRASNALRQALAAGDELVVGLIGDEEVLRNKGSAPIMPFEERLIALQGCKFVHEVIRCGPRSSSSTHRGCLPGFSAMANVCVVASAALAVLALPCASTSACSPLLPLLCCGWVPCLGSSTWH
jgi:hypothetical protein